MNPYSQRIAIAESCEWSGPYGMFSHCASGKQLLTSKQDTLHGTPPEDKGKHEDDCSYKPVPDYLFDLNSMHEAEKVLSEDQWTDYRNHLEEITFCAAHPDQAIISHSFGYADRTKWGSVAHNKAFLSATAAQRQKHSSEHLSYGRTNK